MSDAIHSKFDGLSFRQQSGEIDRTVPIPFIEYRCAHADFPAAIGVDFAENPPLILPARGEPVQK